MRKGQQFTIFKMLIGAVFAVALLVFIYATVTRIECPFTSFEITRDLVLQASKAPNNCFEREKVCFASGDIFSQAGFEQNTPGIRISFLGARGITCSSSGCSFPDKFTMPVSVVCSSTGDCEVRVGQACS